MRTAPLTPSPGHAGAGLRRDELRLRLRGWRCCCRCCSSDTARPSPSVPWRSSASALSIPFRLFAFYPVLDRSRRVRGDHAGPLADSGRPALGGGRGVRGSGAGSRVRAGPSSCFGVHRDLRKGVRLCDDRRNLSAQRRWSTSRCARDRDARCWAGREDGITAQTFSTAISGCGRIRCLPRSSSTFCSPSAGGVSLVAAAQPQPLLAPDSRGAGVARVCRCRSSSRRHWSASTLVAISPRS